MSCMQYSTFHAAEYSSISFFFFFVALQSQSGRQSSKLELDVTSLIAFEEEQTEQNNQI